MSGQGTLSPADYAKSTGLQTLLSKAVNDCYLTQSQCPAATMSQLLRATYTIDTFSDIYLTEVCDGDGSGFTVEVTACLSSGLKASTIVSHSNSTVPFHPNTSGRRIALIPKEVLAATGPKSLQVVLCPPPPPPPATKKGGDGGAAGKGQPPANALGDVDPQSLATAAALAKATRFRLTSSVAYFNDKVRAQLMPLRAVAQARIDDTLYMCDPSGPFEHLLGQVAAGISMACAKVAAAALNKPLALYIGGLYQVVCGREHAPSYSPQRIGGGSSQSPPSPSSTVAGGGRQQASGSEAAAIEGSMNSYSIPDLVVTVFSTDPRGMGRVRVREVCLVVNTQRCLNGALGMDTIGTVHAIVEVAVAKAAAIAAASCGASVTEVESTMMPVMPDGSVRFPFFESIQQIVDLMEQSIREVTGNGGGATPAAGGTSPLGASLPLPKQSGGPLRDFTVGLVIDGGLCYRPQLGKYALINGEPEVTGALMAEQLAAVVAGMPASSGASPPAAAGVAGSSGPPSPTPTVPATFTASGVVTYLEDTHSSVDTAAMQRLLYRVGGNSNVIIAGNHLYGSDATALVQGGQGMLTNNAVLRMNDVGRLSTLLENARLFRNSYRGASIGIIGEAMEGDGAAVAHLAIGVHARTLRVGGLLRKEHAAIINELLRMCDYLQRCGMLARSAPTYDHGRMAMPNAPAEIVVEAVAVPTKKGRK